MIRRRAPTLWLPLFLLLAQSFVGPEAHGFGATYQSSFKRQLNFLVSKNPRYTWGGSTNIAGGLDCSGYLYLAAKWAGVPDVTRTTAYRMSQGFGGWTSRPVSIETAQECDLVFWTFSATRPHGHVGALMRITPGERFVTHASSKRGVIAEPLSRPLTEALSGVRRLTIGD